MNLFARVAVYVLCAVVPPSFAADGALSPEVARAAVEGRAQALSVMLEKGAGVDARDAQGRTALMLAAGAGQYESVRVLIVRGATKELVDGAGRSALDLATAGRHGNVIALLNDGS